MSNLPSTAPDVFDEFLPLGLAAYPDRAREINGIFAFKIEGEGGGNWLLDCTSTPPKITRGEGTAGCTIEMDHEDFKKILTDHNHGIDMYFQNKLRITGDANLALKLDVFFDVTRPIPG